MTATEVRPIVGGRRQPCPFSCGRAATAVIVTGEVRGVFCPAHEAAARADHAKALRWLARRA